MKFIRWYHFQYSLLKTFLLQFLVILFLGSSAYLLSWDFTELIPVPRIHRPFDHHLCFGPYTMPQIVTMAGYNILGQKFATECLRILLHYHLAYSIVDKSDTFQNPFVLYTTCIFSLRVLFFIHGIMIVTYFHTSLLFLFFLLSWGLLSRFSLKAYVLHS